MQGDSPLHKYEQMSAELPPQNKQPRPLKIEPKSISGDPPAVLVALFIKYTGRIVMLWIAARYGVGDALFKTVAELFP